jgi:cytochrome c peroxidase
MKLTRSVAVSAAVACALLAACVGATRAPVDEDALFEKATLYFKPLPESAPNPENVLSDTKVSLGRALYFDKRLSRMGTVSCDSCHSLAQFGVDRLATSPGDDGRTGERNSPTVLNAALHGTQFWDGRAENVEEQAGMPILNPIEMGIPSEQFLVDRLSRIPEYVSQFGEAFPDDPEPLSYRNIELALGAFERTLLTPSPFDEYLHGDREALDVTQRVGLETFLDLGCASCHNGVNLGAASFRKFGLNEDYWVHTKSERIDEGRVEVTGEEGDRYVFRVASLRNIAETPPYFHDGSVENLDEAIRIMVQLQVGTDSDEVQTESLTAFLGSLTGELHPDVLRGIEEETGKL